MDKIIGIKRKLNAKAIVRMNSKNIQVTSELSMYFSVMLITPESYKLIDSYPSIFRRKLLDWGVFHVN